MGCHKITHPNLPLKREGTCDFTLAPLGRGIKGEGLTNNEIFRFAQDDKSYLLHRFEMLK